MADHAAGGAVVDRVVGGGVEDRRLQDAGREHDVLQVAAVRVVDLRRHAPVAPVDRPLAAPDHEGPVVGGGRAHVGHQIVAADDDAGVVAPLVGVAHLDGDRVELAQRLGLGAGAHPGQRLHVRAERLLEVDGQRRHAGLGGRREPAFGVGLADGPLQRAEAGVRVDVAVLARDHVQAALPARRLLGLAAERPAVQLERGVREGARQVTGGVVEAAERHPRLEHRQGRGGHRGGDLRERGVLHRDQRAAVAHLRGLQELVPRERGRERLQFRARDRVVLGDSVALLHLGPAHLGDVGLECQHLGRDRVGVGPAGQRQHLRDVGPIGVALLRVVGLQVVVDVGQAQVGLRDVGRIDRGLLQVDVERHRERAREDVDGGAAHQGGQRRQVGGGADGVELGREGAHAHLLDACLVHVGGVERAHLAAQVGGLFGHAVRQVLEDRVQPAVDGARHAAAARHALLVGRDPGAREEAAVGVLEEVVAGLRGEVARGEVEAEGRELGPGVGGARQRRERAQRGGGQGLLQSSLRVQGGGDCRARKQKAQPVEGWA